MEWRSLKFDWNRVRAFLATAEEGSLSAGARALDTTQSTLGRQVAALEKELGTTLFERSGRGLQLTASGLELLEHARAMGEAASQLSLIASGRSNSIEGTVCIAATEVMATFVLPPLLRKLRRVAPAIHIELVASNQETDLKRREADVAIRGFRPTQPDLIARKLRDVSARLYAARAYLAQLGHPQKPEDFDHADFLSVDKPERSIAWLNAQGFRLTARNFSVTTESRIVQWELVKQGMGIGIMPEAIGDTEPLVARVIADLPPLTATLWLVAHRELHTSRRVRTVFDFLALELS